MICAERDGVGRKEKFGASLMRGEKRRSLYEEEFEAAGRKSTREADSRRWKKKQGK